MGILQDWGFLGRELLKHRGLKVNTFVFPAQQMICSAVVDPCWFYLCFRQIRVESESLISDIPAQFWPGDRKSESPRAGKQGGAGVGV